MNDFDNDPRASAGIERRRVLQFASLAGLAAWGLPVLSACQSGGSSADASASKTLRLGHVPSAGQEAAVELILAKNLAAKSGLSLKTSVFTSTTAAGPALVGGSLDLMAMGDLPAFPVLSTSPVVALCPMLDFSADQAIVANSNVKDAPDLVGKKIALYKGSVSQLLLAKYADRFGLVGDQLSVTNMSPDQQLAGLASGNLDVIVTWQPYVEQAVQKIPGAHVLAFADHPYSLTKTYSMLVVRKDALNQKRQAVQEFVKLLVGTLPVLHSGSDDRLLADYMRNTEKVDLPTSTLVKFMHRRNYSMTIDQEWLDTESAIQQFLVKAGRMSAVVPVSEWLDTSVMKQVAPHLVKI